MNEDDVVTIVRAHIEQKFPMVCSKCGRRFTTLRDYLLNTTHVGSPVSYDAELKDWRPCLPIGTMSFANCKCGTTLSISSQGMGLLAMWRLLRWARKESLQRKITTRELLDGVRSKIDQQVLSESEALQAAEDSR